MPRKRKVSAKPKPKRLPRDYGVKRLIKKRPVTIKGINALTKEIGLFIKPVDYSNRGKRGEAMKQVISRNRANDSGLDVARKKAIYVKGLPTRQYVAGELVGKKTLLPKNGCHPACLVLYESLKAIQKKTKVPLNPKISRVQPAKGKMAGSLFSSTVVFELNGKFFEADPFYARHGANIKEITKKDAKKRRYVPPTPISYEAAKLEAFSQNAVKKLLESNDSMD